MASIYNDKFGDRFARVAALRPARGRAMPRRRFRMQHTSATQEILASSRGCWVRPSRQPLWRTPSDSPMVPHPEPCLSENDSRAERVLRLLLRGCRFET